MLNGWKTRVSVLQKDLFGIINIFTTKRKEKTVDSKIWYGLNFKCFMYKINWGHLQTE